MSRAITFPNATRITVVDETGRAFERRGSWKGGAEIHLQDDGRTVKVFLVYDLDSSFGVIE